jgi:dienelactone hydrolase
LYEKALSGKIFIRHILYFYPKLFAMKMLWIFLLSLLVSCAQQSGNKNSNSNRDVSREQSVNKTQTLHKNIRCKADGAFGYALYLPDAYNNREKMLPVIFFFDAHKRGAMPVEKYANLADKYGFVLAGSNNSTNGQQAEEMQKAVSMMLNDVSKRFRIDKNRMATAGFSGGARVAADVALFQNKGVSAVIGCAAGFPQMRAAYNSNFSYLGMVGDKDFNYLEMKNLNRALDQTSIEHYLLVYDGKHDWPPANVMREGFEFLLFDAMRQNPALKDEVLISDFLTRNDSIRKKASAEKDLEKQAAADEKILTFLKGLTVLEKYKEELASIQKNPAYISSQKAQKKSLELERSRQQQYASAMPTKSLEWWLNEIRHLTLKQDDPVDQRLLNYLSLVSYMYASGTLKNNQFQEAEKYLTIYEKVDPENPEVYYLKAALLVRTGKPQQAIPQLQKAADKGFDEYERMHSSKDFQRFHGDEAFEKILLQVKKAAAQ